MTPTTGRRRGRRRGRAWFLALVALVVLIVAAVVADVAARAYAERQIEQRLSSAGKTEVRIGGFSFLAQYLSGRLDRIEIDAPALQLHSIAVPARVVALDTSVGDPPRARQLTGSFELDQDALDSLLSRSDGAPSLILGDGTVTSSGRLSVFGRQLDYTVEFEPGVDGGHLVFTPVGATLGDGGDATALGDLGRFAVSVCAAQFLPQGVAMTAVSVTPAAMTIEVSGSSVVLSRATLSTTGRCEG